MPLNTEFRYGIDILPDAICYQRHVTFIRKGRQISVFVSTVLTILREPSSRSIFRWKNMLVSYEILIVILYLLYL